MKNDKERKEGREERYRMGMKETVRIEWAQTEERR